MKMLHRLDIPLIDRMKIYAEVIGPVVRKLRDELGRKRADEVILEALKPWRRELGAKLLQVAGWPKPAAKRGYDYSRAGEAFDSHVLADDEERFDFNVTGCRYAQFLREIGDPDLGFLLACSGDFDMFDSLDGAELQRTQTIMQGASHCDFRIRFSSPADS